MKRSVVVGALGTAQTLAWGSSYYLPAILADPIAHGLGLSRTIVFGPFSGALLLSAVLGPAVGCAIDNRGGRGVLALSNLVLATGLVLLGLVIVAELLIGNAALYVGAEVRRLDFDAELAFEPEQDVQQIDGLGAEVAEERCIWLDFVFVDAMNVNVRQPGLWIDVEPNGTP